MATCTKLIFANGTREWRLNGKLHREGDEPARILADGSKEWCIAGRFHRDGDQPAVVRANGRLAWYRNGQLHREGDEPAVVNSDGGQEWWTSHVRHRGGGKPAVMQSYGFQEWWTHGTLMLSKHVTDFQQTSRRFAFVQAIVRISSKCAACRGQCDTYFCVLRPILAAVQAACRAHAPSYHVAHEYAFLVALFL